MLNARDSSSATTENKNNLNEAYRALIRNLSVRHASLVILGFVILYVLFLAPVLFSDRVLAPGDGIIYFLPNFASPRVWWDTHIWGGFPAVGDSQLMRWYPPALFFSLFGTRGFQPFLITAYVLASSLTYGFVFSLTRSRLAAAFSGCVYGLNAFMVAHLGHAAVVHAAAWLPLIVWSFSKLQEKTERSWFAVAVLAVGCCALAGHPQIFAYSLLTAAAFVVFTGWRGPNNRWRYYAVCALAVALGGGLAAIQFWPTSELASHSLRVALNFKEFVAYELPLRQAPMLLFPLLYGGAPGTFYRTPYFGAWPSSADGWGAGELSGYVGLITLVLAAVGFITQRRKAQARFWLGACVVAFLLTLGETTPLARLIYVLPVLNKFRVPARHFLELSFALSVLAGYGVSALQEQRATVRLLRRTIIATGSVLLACVILLQFFAGKINELAVQFLAHKVSLAPWANPAIGLPVVLFCLGGAALFFWQQMPNSRPRCSLLIIALLVDLGSFGWFYEWHYRAPYKAYLRMPAAAENYRAETESTFQRVLPIRGGTGRVSELPPNLSRLWGVVSASGYGPFILTRLSQLLTMPPHGSVDDSWRDPLNQGLDLLSVRYVLVPPEAIGPPSSTDETGTRWVASDFAVDVGPGCSGANPISYRIDLPQAVQATSLGVVGALACSVEIPDGQQVLSVKLTSDDGAAVTQTFRAGQDFSEWAFDCADVTPIMKHRRAKVFRSYPMPRGTGNCEAHQYVARAKLNLGSLSEFSVKHIELRWVGSSGTFALKKITLLNHGDRESTPISPENGSLGDAARWRQVGEINVANSGYGPEVKAPDLGVGEVFENLRARPRAWLVPQAMNLPAEEIFKAIRTSRLPDGRPFDPALLALVEAPISLTPQQADENRSAEIVGLSADEMQVRTNSAGAGFLVTSDVFYPGWEATIDGAPVTIYQTDYALRGVQVPSGTHLVRFQFRPRSFYYGIALSTMSLLLLIAVMRWWQQLRFSPSSN
jgi:hypothetical protein